MQSSGTPVGPSSAALIAELAQERGIRITVAESLTGGAVANALAAAPGASRWFAGAVIAYALEVKQQVLGLEIGVDPASDACAQQMAVGVRAVMDADIAVSTTGVGGPDAEGDHPAGEVHIGWSAPSGSGAFTVHFEGDPSAVLDQTVSGALALIAELAGEAQ